MYRELDPLLLSQLRLAVMSYLMVVREAEFNTLKEKTGATAGNLSVQIGKLQEAGYITVEKTYKNNYPLTICRIAGKGIEAFEAFYADLKIYYDGGKK
ncbi:MAG: transcriptional regulator [Saprospiraceae bacterium]|nr:transcriptional regulator [Saprospiraceae bacterium]MCB0542464.1 transcriptional regulator [Saprospiraceae bacterium]MCB9355536.1 transcriptional regulator [Lewinellaceae bacterium]